MTEPDSLIYRWIDAAGASSYMRHDAMIGRVRHWLPKQISGLDKLYRKRGLSFAMKFGYWMDEDLPIGFAVDPQEIDNRIVRIDGHQIFLFSDMMDLHRSGLNCSNSLTRQRSYAIETSLANPDEAFVIGDIRSLASVTRGIVVRNEAAFDRMRPWCERHGIPIRAH